MGLLLGALDNPIMQDQMTGKQQFIYTAKQMGQRSWHSAKTFAVMGLVFSAAECVVEKVSLISQNDGEWICSVTVLLFYSFCPPANVFSYLL